MALPSCAMIYKTLEMYVAIYTLGLTTLFLTTRGFTSCRSNTTSLVEKFYQTLEHWNMNRETQAKRGRERQRWERNRDGEKQKHYRHPTSSTRPKPPTPNVSMMLKSTSFRLEKKAFSASYLHFLKWKKGNFLEVWMEQVMGNDRGGEGAGRLFCRSLSFRTGIGINSRILTSLWSGQVKQGQTNNRAPFMKVNNMVNKK